MPYAQTRTVLPARAAVQPSLHRPAQPLTRRAPDSVAHPAAAAGSVGVRVRAGLMGTLLLVSGATALAQQSLIPGQSEIGFTARQMGVPLSGHFKQFDAQIQFDPAQPARSSVALRIDMASATMGSKEIDSELPTAPWFNVPRFATATFRATTIKAAGPGRFDVSGPLSIKGQTQTVQVPVTLTRAGAVTVASGVLPIKRTAFKVGDGDWADTSMVADEVQVRFKLALAGVPKW